ncbi:MAG: hypothetical protein HY863_04715 [Chloroflexi bacterium]|nr:hypothetical protein [Chloroflexota bacterium]
MRHPLEFIPQNLRKPMFYTFFALTILIFGIFSQSEQYLRTSAAPSGIVSFELARDLKTSQAIVDSWDVNARLVAAFGLGFDYLFMPVYAFALSLGLLLAMNGKSGGYHYFAAWMGWGAFTAALFDAVENYALWNVLVNGAASPYPQIAALCASVKFTLLIFGLITALAGRFVKR